MADIHDTPQPDEPARLNAETAVAREARLRWEAAVIAKGHAEIDAGLGLDWDDVEAWLRDLDRDPNAQKPRPRRFAGG